MVDKNNLPATTTAKGTLPALPSQTGTLMARGLAAIRTRSSFPVGLPAKAEDQGPAEEYCPLYFDDAVDAWKRRDTVEAIENALAAADLGHSRAQELLGAIYSLCPESNIRDYVRAYVWYSLAIEHMAGTDCWWMIDEVKKSRDRVAGMLSAQQLAKAHQLAADWAPWGYTDEGHGKPQNPGKKCDIAEMYAEGKHLIKNLSLAVKWWLKAAEQGSDHAQNELAEAFANGIGVPQDLVAAHAWFSIVWENESITSLTSPSPEERRTEIEQLMTTEQIVEARQRASDWKKRHGKHIAP
jgi:TPR repeat protein